MRKIFTPLLWLILLSSCFTQVNYVGNSYPPTRKVDVYISQSAVKKTYEVIGKGYVQNQGSAEAIQRRAIEKAQMNGAHAVIIEDYFLVDHSTSIAVKTDSASLSSKQKAVIHPTLGSGFNILFIRYKEE